MKWAYVVVWRDVKQRNTAVVVDLYLTIRFVAQCGVCVAARASAASPPRGSPLPGRDREAFFLSEASVAPPKRKVGILRAQGSVTRDTAQIALER